MATATNIIAAAFLVEVRLGIATALAVAAHEIPQETGDYIGLLNAGFHAPTRAVLQRLVRPGSGSQ